MPVVENPPLARALYAAVDLDDEIPVEHYQAVAKVIGYVMRLKERPALSRFTAIAGEAAAAQDGRGRRRRWLWRRRAPRGTASVKAAGRCRIFAPPPSRRSDGPRGARSERSDRRHQCGLPEPPRRRSARMSSAGPSSTGRGRRAGTTSTGVWRSWFSAPAAAPAWTSVPLAGRRTTASCRFCSMPPAWSATAKCCGLILSAREMPRSGRLADAALSRRRRCRRSASWPAGLPTTSTICSPR